MKSCGGKIASSRPSLSVVVPLYRDEDALEAIFERCEPVLSEAGGGELVLVDDGGFDGTARRAVAMAATYSHPVTVVSLARNFGQHPAVFAGLAHAVGERVVTMDSDLQYPPEDIPRLLAELSDTSPVVSGYRQDRKDPMLRRLTIRVLTRWLNAQTGYDLRDFGSMFRAYDRATVDLMLTFTERHRLVPAIVAWLGVPIKEIPVSHEGRGDQGTRYRLSSLWSLFFDLITGYTVFPLRLIVSIGLVTSALGCIGTLSFGVYRLVEGTGVSGTVSAFALVFGLLGVQLLITAVLGEYVGRVYSEAKGRPYYVIRDVKRITTENTR